MAAADFIACSAQPGYVMLNSFKEFGITWPGGAEHAMKSAAAILSNFYDVKQR
jgi:hypothetical protein